MRISVKHGQLESAIGSLRQAAKLYADDGENQTASKITQLAEEASTLREPHVAAFLDQRRAEKRAALQAGAVA